MEGGGSLKAILQRISLRRWVQRASHPVILSTASLIFAIGFVLGPVMMRWFVIREDRLEGIQYGDIVAIAALIATILIAVFSIIPNLNSMATGSRFAHYSELDRMYNDLLALAIAHPELRRPDSLPSDLNTRSRYDAYAYMVWNFIETIHDRCVSDTRLKGTWAPVIRAEQALHKAWFETETKPYLVVPAPKFCIEFCDFIWSAFESPAAERDAWIDTDWTYRTREQILADPAAVAWLYATPPPTAQGA